MHLDFPLTGESIVPRVATIYYFVCVYLHIFHFYRFIAHFAMIESLISEPMAVHGGALDVLRHG